MSDIYSVKERMHKMRAKLYQNYLPGSEGTYIARTVNEASVTVGDICAAMKNRGGYDGSYEDAVQTVKHFFMEMMYQLSDGFSVNSGYFTIHPNIGGVFHSDSEAHDHKKHPITFRFQPLKALRDLRDNIDVIIEGVADTQGYIAEFIDYDLDSVNTLYSPNDQFAIHGHKIKIAGDDSGVGIFFVPVEDPTKAVRVTRTSENTASKVMGICPHTGYLHNRIEIVTQFSGAHTLRTPRRIVSSFIIDES